MSDNHWRVVPEFVNGNFVGYILINERGQTYNNEDGVVTWLDEAKAEVDCALLNAGVGDGRG